MTLKRLDLRVSDHVNEQVLDHSIQCVNQLYYRCLGKVNLPGCNYINIWLTDDKNENGKTEKFANFWDYYIVFDFNYYNKLNGKYDKKLFILNTLHQAMVNQSSMYGWQDEIFIKAYEDCISRKIVDDWFFKNKLFLSPNKKCYMALYSIHDLGTYDIYEILYDKNKQELARRKCFHDNGTLFRIDWASWEGQNEIFYYKFNGPQKRFECIISELLSGKQYELPEKMDTSKFFKR